MTWSSIPKRAERKAARSPEALKPAAEQGRTDHVQDF